MSYKNIFALMGTKWFWALLAVAAIAMVAALSWTCSAVEETHAELVSDSTIDITPEQIQSIRAVGEWEFLSVSCEEMVDTTRKGILSDDHLARIYYGTLRLGVNLHQAAPGWIKSKGDSVIVTLPKVGLLDRDFIDEARTTSFFESGRWTAADREALYRRAYLKMIAHGMTPENIKNAQDNADAQFRRMFRAMGYTRIGIRFEK